MDKKLIAIEEWDEALSQLTETEEMERRRAERRRAHRREKRLQAGIDVAWITILCGCCFIIGLCVGGWTL